MNKTNYLVLVNKENKLPDNWEDTVELVEEIDCFGDHFVIEKNTIDKFNELRKSLLKENIRIEIDNSYRSIKRQEEIINEFKKKCGPGYVEKYVSVPGYSEHHTGLAIDIFLIKDGKVIMDNDELFKEKELFNIIHNRLSCYGFILRYVKGKESITGYNYEPWHIRYIDDIKIAKEIMDNKITLEEYLNK